MILVLLLIKVFLHDNPRMTLAVDLENDWRPPLTMGNVCTRFDYFSHVSTLKLSTVDMVLMDEEHYTVS